jgi:signal transduction histidine kinase
MSNDTWFAPAPRLSAAQVLAQLDTVRSEAGLTRGLDAVPTMVAVLNGARQLVFANRAMLEAAGGAGGVEGLCGGRPGEILGCIRSAEGPGGCGTSPACRFCGAGGAIVEALATGKPVARTCRITTRAGQRLAALDLAAEAVPFEIGGTRYLLLSMRDIAPRMRRAALERVFFHDILNTVSGLKMQLDILRTRQTTPEGRSLVDRTEEALAALVEEIQAQKVLVSAENGTLRVQRNLIAAAELVRELIAQFERGQTPPERTLSVAASSEPISFVSDATLVRRILANMISNALEAAPPGSTVSVGFRPTPASGGVELLVRNSGTMSEEVRRQLFQRSFSTKGDGRGLGTWSMKLLAEDYLGGSVSFTSDPAEGTTFVLSLPLALPMRS